MKECSKLQLNRVGYLNVIRLFKRGVCVSRLYVTECVGMRRLDSDSNRLFSSGENSDCEVGLLVCLAVHIGSLPTQNYCIAFPYFL